MVRAISAHYVGLTLDAKLVFQDAWSTLNRLIVLLRISIYITDKISHVPCSRLAILSHVFEILHPSYGSRSSTSLSFESSSLLESPMTSALAFSRSDDEMLETSLFILAGEGESGVGLAGSSSSLDSIISTEQIFRFATLRVC